MILHTDLVVRSMDAALDFYNGKLGFSIVDDSVVRGPLPRHLSCGRYETMRLVLLRVSRVGAMIELLEFRDPAGLATQQHEFPRQMGLTSILVANLTSYVENLRGKGLHPASEVFSVVMTKQGTCNVVFYEDPDGNRIEFVQVTTVDAPASDHR